MTTQGDVEWQRLWFMLRAHNWTSLAVVGINSAGEAVHVANRIAELGSLDKRIPIRRISAIGMPWADVADVVARLDEEPTLSVVVCDSPLSNPAMIPILQAVSGVVLVVRLGESLLDSVRKTVASVGREHVLATVSIG